jgi:stage V sporulation protein AE
MVVKAAAVGGLICMVAQVLIDRTKLTPARILVSFVVLGVVLGGIGVYDYLVDFAGCGATVPLTGFGYTLAAGTREAIAEKGALGILPGALTGAAGGITAAMVFGFLCALIAKPGDKA